MKTKEICFLIEQEISIPCALEKVPCMVAIYAQFRYDKDWNEWYFLRIIDAYIHIGSTCKNTPPSKFIAANFEKDCINGFSLIENELLKIKPETVLNGGTLNGGIPDLNQDYASSIINYFNSHIDIDKITIHVSHSCK